MCRVGWGGESGGCGGRSTPQKGFEMARVRGVEGRYLGLPESGTPDSLKRDLLNR